MGFLISASLTKSEPSDIKTSHLYMCFKRNKATSSALMFMLSVQKVECQQCKFCYARSDRRCTTHSNSASTTASLYHPLQTWKYWALYPKYFDSSITSAIYHGNTESMQEDHTGEQYSSQPGT